MDNYSFNYNIDFFISKYKQIITRKYKQLKNGNIKLDNYNLAYIFELYTCIKL